MAPGASTSSERLFVAIPLTENVRSELQRRLPRELPGRTIVSRNWHFTLRFLGSTHPEQRERVIAGIRARRLGKPFTIAFARLGAFPNTGRARVLWIGVSNGAERMVAVAEAVESAARAAGYEGERRPFRPHLTLSRLDPPQSVRDVVLTSGDLHVEMRVPEIVLFRSRLGRGPAEYESVARFALGAGQAG